MTKSMEIGNSTAFRSPPEDWMNPIPESWECKRARYCFQERKEKTETGEEPHFSLTKDRGLLPREQLTDNNQYAESLEGYKIIREGDIVMNKMESWNGFFGVADELGIVSPDYTVMNPNPEFVPEYLKFLFKTPMYLTQFEWRSRGVGESYLRLRTRELKEIPIYVPPYDQQEQIVEIIDSAISTNDKLRTAVSDLSSFSSDRLKSLINSLVIEGRLNSSITKQSKVSWINEIPSHWTESKLKFVSTEIIDSEHKTPPVHPDGEYRIIRTSDVRSGELKLEQCERTTKSVYEEWTQRGEPEEGDLILTREAPAGEVGIVESDTDILLGQRTVLIKPDESDILPEYLLYILRSDLLTTHISLNSRGSTVSHVNLRDLKETPILLPPKSEQEKILQILSTHNDASDSIKRLAEKMIRSLDERENSLLTAITTGQGGISGEKYLEGSERE